MKGEARSGARGVSSNNARPASQHRQARTQRAVPAVLANQDERQGQDDKDAHEDASGNLLLGGVRELEANREVKGVIKRKQPSDNAKRTVKSALPRTWRKPMEHLRLSFMSLTRTSLRSLRWNVGQRLPQPQQQLVLQQRMHEQQTRQPQKTSAPQHVRYAISTAKATYIDRPWT